MARSDDAVALSFSESWGRLVAGLIAWCGDWDLAEECAAEAFAEAVPAWERVRRARLTAGLADHGRPQPGPRPDATTYHRGRRS